jgi:autotransporter-associated beta strand protein
MKEGDMGGLRVNNDGLDPSGTGWALVSLVPSTTNITGTGNLSAVGGSGSLNPIFQGGTLKVDSATTTSTAFTIKATGGKIDANGLRAVFSGAFSNAVGESGKLTITNTGTAGQGAVVLSTANTYSGGTEVQAGAVLSIASSDALGSGTLALVGSSTVPATLTTTATTTISNAITVTGDPVFNVAPNTTTTVSAAITDGVSAGDVVVSGGGTLALTAVNTYTALCKG